MVIHSGALMKRTRREALDIALRSLKAVIAACDDAGYGHIALCPETMGKINQLGDLDEVLELCTLDERLVPCVDFGHLYARSLGELEGTAACASMLDRIEAVLGAERAGAFHSHFSKIQFTPNGGEKMHLTFAQDDFGPDPAPLMAEVARRGWSPTFICESAGTQAEDALTMKKSCIRHVRSEGMGRFRRGPAGAGRRFAPYKRFPEGKTLMPGEFSSPVQMKGRGPWRAKARWGKRRHPGGGRADYEKVVSGMSEVRGWGACRGPAERGGALRRTSVFPKGKPLMPGEFSSPVQMKGAGPRRAKARWGKRRHPGGGRADYEKVVSGMSEVRGWGACRGPAERGGALRRTSVFPKGKP